jgi:CheY-like chemotaxis protein
MLAEPLVILLAEDDEGHASLVRRNLKRSGVVNEIVHVNDGQEALDYVRALGKYSDRPRVAPMLLLLDINMPRVDGIEVLRQIKQDEKHNRIPVIMLTTTDDPREISRAYELGCSVYVTKPVAYEAFVEAVSRLGLFLQVVRVPPETGSLEISAPPTNLQSA